MTKVNPYDENKTNSDIFSWDRFKSDTIFFLSKYIKAFQWLSKSEFLNFMTKVNPNNGNGSFHVKSSDNPGTFNLRSQK